MNKTQIEQIRGAVRLANMLPENVKFIAIDEKGAVYNVLSIAEIDGVPAAELCIENADAEQSIHSYLKLSDMHFSSFGFFSGLSNGA